MPKVLRTHGNLICSLQMLNHLCWRWISSWESRNESQANVCSGNEKERGVRRNQPKDSAPSLLCLALMEATGRADLFIYASASDRSALESSPAMKAAAESALPAAFNDRELTSRWID